MAPGPQGYYRVVACLLVSVVLGWLFMSYHKNTLPGVGEAHALVSGATGRLFRMEESRSFARNMLHSNRPKDASALKALLAQPKCAKWIVITTINPPSKTVLQVTSLQGWCAVIVLDTSTPDPMEFKLSVQARSTNDSVVVLTAEDQATLPFHMIKSVPWKHFGRKNIGFIYAIARGAEIIYDTDDDNELLKESPIEEAVPVDFRSGEKVQLFTSAQLFNPYPYFGAPQSWPRGFPLDQLKNESTFKVPKNGRMLEGEDREVLWVHQSLANHDPDVDAIYRLTRTLPFDFSPSPHTAMALGSPAVSPYNAQATIHFKKAFWGMLLPITVHGRVSDIWRSYFTQRLLLDVGGKLVFRAPWVVQNRNEHSYLADLDSEMQLYMRAGALVEYLASWRGGQSSPDVQPPMSGLRERIMELNIQMYKCGIIELNDVQLVFDWLNDLGALDYEFPALIA